MSSALLDALNEIDSTAMKSTSSKAFRSSRECGSNSESESTDIEIMSEHDYALRAAGPTGNKHRQNAILSPAEIDTASTCSVPVKRSNLDVYDLSNSDDQDSSPVKRGCQKNPARGRGSTRGRSRPGGSSLRQASSGRPGGQRNSPKIKAIDITAIPQYQLSVVKCGTSPSGSPKTRLHLMCLPTSTSAVGSPTAEAAGKTIDQSLATDIDQSSSSSSRMLDSSGTAGEDELATSPSMQLGRPKDSITSPSSSQQDSEKHCVDPSLWDGRKRLERDDSSGVGNLETCTSTSSQLDVSRPAVTSDRLFDDNRVTSSDMFTSQRSSEIVDEVLCPNCGTWSYFIEHCSSCQRNFQHRKPAKYKTKNGEIKSYSVVARPSYRDDVNTASVAPTARQPKTVTVTLKVTATTTEAKPTSTYKPIAPKPQLPVINTDKVSRVTVKKPFICLQASTFYADKLQTQGLSLVSQINSYPKKVQVPAIRCIPRRKGKKVEPVVISIDCDSDNDDPSASAASKIKQQQAADSVNTANIWDVDRLHHNDTDDKARTSRRSRMRDQLGNVIEEKPKTTEPVGTIAKDFDGDAVNSQAMNYLETVIPAALLRIGSLEIEDPAPVEFRTERFLFNLGTNYPVHTIYLDTKCIISCEYSFSSGISIIFIETNSQFATFVRERLKMIRGQALFDPESKVAAERRIIFRPKSSTLSQMTSTCLESIFAKISAARNIQNEMLFRKLNLSSVTLALGQSQLSNTSLEDDYKARIFPYQMNKEQTASRPGLVFVKEYRSSSRLEPIPVLSLRRLQAVPSAKTITVNTDDSLDDDKSTPQQPVEILVYPPAPVKGRIVVHQVDLLCLEKGEFLNDVIIDFYIKYLLHEVLNESQREKTFVFSSFFYGRLMRREYQREAPFRGDTPLTRMEKRHQKVRTWTRNVDIFQKDFIIVPINEHCHWYVAIICFPSLAADPQYQTHTPPSSQTLLANPLDASSSHRTNHATPTTQDNRPTFHPAHQCSTNHSTPSPGHSQTAPHDEDNGDDTEEPMELDDSQSDQQSDQRGKTGPGTPSPDRHSLPSAEGRKQDVANTVSSDCQPSLMSPGSLYAQHHSNHYKRPCILVFDSLGGPCRRNVVQNLREYLTIEWQTRKNTRCIFDTKTMKAHHPKVPQQNNFSDCGVYLLQYVEMFYEIPIVNFSIPIKGLEGWFPESEVNKKRDRIRQLIYDLKERQEVGTR